MPSIYSISLVWCLDSLHNLRQNAAWQRNVFMVTGSGIAASHVCETCGQWLASGSGKGFQSGPNKLRTPPMSSESGELEKHLDDTEQCSLSTECSGSDHRARQSLPQLLDINGALRAFAPSMSARGSEAEAYIRPKLRRTSMSQSSLTTVR